MRGLADVHRPRRAGDPALRGRAQVVGVDVQAHGALACGAGAGGAARPQRFGQHHAHAAVQQAVGLLGARVHGHARAQEIVADLGEFDAQVRYRAALVPGVEFVEGEGFGPNGHRVSGSFARDSFA